MPPQSATDENDRRARRPLTRNAFLHEAEWMALFGEKEPILISGADQSQSGALQSAPIDCHPCSQVGMSRITMFANCSVLCVALSSVLCPAIAIRAAPDATTAE